MFINQIKIAGNDVNVIMTGSHYYFFSNFYGVIGVAVREYLDDDYNSKFTIMAGSDNTLGGRLTDSVIAQKMKSVIKKEETRHIKKNIEFVESNERCHFLMVIKTATY